MKLVAGALILSAALMTSAFAQETVKLINVGELSGPGATVGTNFKNAADLAVAEINAKGGLLGHKIAITHMDTQTNPGVARAVVQKALDENAYALMGPGYSGSVKVTAPLVTQAGIAQVMGGEAAELTQLGFGTLFRTSFGQQSSMPKIAKYPDPAARSPAAAGAFQCLRSYICEIAARGVVLTWTGSVGRVTLR
jgi:branched-chain amino acid transport system substrate-binding protein